MPPPRAYYNETDPFAAVWLRELITAGAICPGDVDERSISDVTPGDLAGFTQHHFFAGIGGWSAALRLAGWPDDRPVWTGSCPCQPFSVAGKEQGFADLRHLWPDWFWLIQQHRPDVVLGEQVEAAIRHGWLDLVQADLEGDGYACGAVGVPAAGVGAFHGRHRIWFVAERVAVTGSQLAGRRLRGSVESLSTDRGGAPDQSGGSSGAGDVADPRRGADERRSGSAASSATAGSAESEAPQRQRRGAAAGAGGASSELADARHDGRDSARGVAAEPCGDGADDGISQRGSDGLRSSGPVAESDGGLASDRDLQRSGRHRLGAEDPPAGFWDDVAWLPCRDGKHRPTQPGLFPLAHGVPGRVGRLRGYGNAIVPQVAAEVIGAYMDLRGIARC